MRLADRKSTPLFICLTAALLIMLIIPAYAIKPPDTLQVFGVGTRADSMGDAFVAVANDASAVFWNPAGLSLVTQRGVTTVGKQLPAVNMSASFTNANQSEFASLDLMHTSGNNATSASGGTEATFFATTLPVGNNGVFGISQTITGYIQQRQHLTGDFIYTTGSGELKKLEYVGKSTSQINQTAVTYGWCPANTLRAGLGVVAVKGEFESIGQGTLTYSDPGGDTVATATNSLNSEGTGYGYTLGTLWSPKFKNKMDLTFGASYMSKVSISDLDERFGNEIGDRLLLGASFRRNMPNKAQALWSLQFSRFGASNSDSGGAVARAAVWNFYLGGEYDTAITAKQRYYQIRYGMFTNKSPNSDYYGTENWLTFGLGTGRSDNSWKLDMAFQHAIKTNLSLLSLSSDIQF